MDDITAATALLKTFDWDTDAVIQLLVVANSFRGMLRDRLISVVSRE